MLWRVLKVRQKSTRHPAAVLALTDNDRTLDPKVGCEWRSTRVRCYFSPLPSIT